MIHFFHSIIRESERVHERMRGGWCTCLKSDGEVAEERGREIESKRRVIEKYREREAAREVVSTTEERKVGEGG